MAYHITTADNMAYITVAGNNELYNPVPKRYPSRLQNSSIIEEVIIRIRDQPLSIRFFIEDRFKDSSISGSQWRFSYLASLTWKDHTDVLCYGDSINDAIGNTAKFLDKYLYEKPRTRRDDRLSWHKFMKEQASKNENGKYYDSSDDEYIEVEDDESALKPRPDDDKIAMDLSTSFRYQDRDELILLITSKTSDPIIEYKTKGVILHTSTLTGKSMVEAVPFAYGHPSEIENIDISKLVDRNQYCFQPGCNNKYTIEYTMKGTYMEGHGMCYDNTYSVSYRRFCDKHSKRGDQGTEDVQDNYVLL
jgi:hypothetical protein